MATPTHRKPKPAPEPPNRKYTKKGKAPKKGNK